MDLTIGMISMDEEEAIKKVLPDIKNSLKDYKGKWEILMIDSSKDNTPKIAEKLGARVIRQFPPKGYGNAMKKLLKESSGKIIVTLDCDGTYPVENILKAVNYLEKGYDVVGANRIAKKSKNMPLQNYLANKIFNLLSSILFMKKIKEVHTGMRAYRKEMINSIDFDPSYAALPVDLILVPLKKGFKCYEFDIEYMPRLGETTLTKFNGTTATFKRIFKTRFGRDY